MPLSAGDRLGSYEVVALLGSGGMGEVYRARDTRLGRDVAIKILPPAFAADSHRLARFEREAQLISQIHHPNVCTLFHIGDATNPDARHFIVLELVEGETLHQRLIRGALPVREALRYASDIASALEAAHQKGIIHRDLKPSNIKIAPGGTIKVLDFGVAKLSEGTDAGDRAPDLATATLGGTKEGALVGTVSYMSPEQAMSSSVDKRTDIWSFGCVVYEMLTAQRAFPGLGVADTLAAVIRGEPDWTALPATTSPSIRRLLERCLEKDRMRRLADIADARLEIDDVMAGRSAGKTAPVAPAGGRRRLRGLLAFVFGMLVIAAAFSFGWSSRERSLTPPRAVDYPVYEPGGSDISLGPGNEPPPPDRSRSTEARQEPSQPATPSSAPPASNTAVFNRSVTVETKPIRVSRMLLDGVTWAPTTTGANTILAVSPDGGRVVYSARAGGVTSLWLESLDKSDIRQLGGTEGASSPFWSPDGMSIGFFAGDRLKRLDLSGFAIPVTLCEVPSNRGATWGPDDTIVFARYPGVLHRISANGGMPTPLTRLAPGEPHHVRPHFLAGTNQLIYRVTSPNLRDNAYYAMTVGAYYAMSVGSAGRKLIMRLDAGNLMYASGHLLYLLDNTLIAQPFDVSSLTLSGRPVPIADGIRRSADTAPKFGVFSASQTGRLAYLPEGGGDVPMTVLMNWATVLKNASRGQTP
jgi:hypothetical protein